MTRAARWLPLLFASLKGIAIQSAVEAGALQIAGKDARELHAGCVRSMRALHACAPNHETFPFPIRLKSNDNGLSSSQHTKQARRNPR